MPIIELKISGSEDKLLARELCQQITNLTHEILNKQREVTVVQVSFIPAYLWFINASSLEELKQRSFYMTVRITDSTNLKQQKSAYIAAVHAALSERLIPLHPVSYTALQEMKADAWGYEGQTIEHKFIHTSGK